MVEKNASYMRRDDLVLQARALVGDGELDDVAFLGGVARHDAQLDAPPRGRQLRVVDRLGGVLQQVEDDLLDQDRIDHQRRQALRDVGLDRDVAAAQLDAGEVDRVVDDRLRRRLLALRLAALHEGADAVDDLAGALGLARGLLQRGDQVALVDGVVLDPRHHAVAVVGDRRQRLVQLVRDRRRHLAHRHQPARHLRLLGLAARPRASALRRSVMSVAISICASRPSVHCR